MAISIFYLVHYKQPLQTFLSASFIQISLIVFMGVVFLLIITSHGAAVNDIYTEQT